MKEIIIREDAANQRLDRYLTKYLNDTTRSNIYKLIRKKVFKVNGVRVKEDYFLKAGDTLSIYLADETLAGLVKPVEVVKPENSGLDIVYEDEQLLVVNKPKGLLTHPDHSEFKNTLATRVQYYLKHLCTNTFRPAPIHRLDKNTSGLVIFAKTYEALKHYNACMRSRTVEKYYLCVVEGRVREAGEVKGYLIKDSEKNKVRIVQKDVDEAKFCHTLYTPLKVAKGYTLVEVQLITGRSHQIRASMQLIGHPIVGDVKYGAKRQSGVKNQLLHSHRMVLEGQTFKAGCKEIEAFLENL